MSSASTHSALAGGRGDSTLEHSAGSFIGAGDFNEIGPGSDHSTIGGGGANSIEASYGFTGRGAQNSVQSGPSY